MVNAVFKQFLLIIAQKQENANEIHLFLLEFFLMPKLRHLTQLHPFFLDPVCFFIYNIFIRRFEEVW